MKHRVVVTGMGVVAPNAGNISEFLPALQQGKSGISLVESIDTSAMRVHIGGEVKNFNFTVKNCEKMDRVSLLALAAASEALAESGLKQSEISAAGVTFGTIGGGVKTLEERIIEEKDDPDLVSKISSLSPPRWIARILGFGGEIVTLSNACAAGAIAIGYALDQIRRGRMKVAAAGGAESFNRATFCGFHAVRSLDPVNSRPFDLERQGLVVGEGAGYLILEELEHAKRRGAKIYAEVAGYGFSSDAYHETAPNPTGEGAARAMKNALADASLNPEDVSYINAHGTGTKQNDIMETRAIKRVFGNLAKDIPVSSIKSMIGHTMGAAGALEAIASVLALEHGFIPPTINYFVPDPDCDLDYVPNEARPQSLKVVLSNKFGFGGTNVALVFRKFY